MILETQSRALAGEVGVGLEAAYWANRVLEYPWKIGHYIVRHSNLSSLGNS